MSTDSGVPDIRRPQRPDVVEPVTPLFSSVSMKANAASLQRIRRQPACIGFECPACPRRAWCLVSMAFGCDVVSKIA